MLTETHQKTQQYQGGEKGEEVSDTFSILEKEGIYYIEVTRKDSHQTHPAAKSLILFKTRMRIPFGRSPDAHRGFAKCLISLDFWAPRRGENAHL
jgi:hypothetical protein